MREGRGREVPGKRGVLGPEVRERCMTFMPAKEIPILETTLSKCSHHEAGGGLLGPFIDDLEGVVALPCFLDGPD